MLTKPADALKTVRLTGLFMEFRFWFLDLTKNRPLPDISRSNQAAFSLTPIRTVSLSRIPRIVRFIIVYEERSKLSTS